MSELENSEENVNGYGVINYRLTAIEQQLKDLIQLLIKVPIMNNDIKDLDKRTQNLESKVLLLETKLQNVTTKSIKDKASKWESTLDLIYKVIITACVGALLVKIGIK